METLNEHMNIPEPRTNKPKLTGMKIIYGLLLLIITTIALVFVFTQTPNDVVKAQLSALKKGELNKAYSLTSSDFQQGTSIQRFETFIEKYPILKNSNGIVFNESKTEGTIGYINGKLEDKEGNTATIEYQLAKENDRWTIQALRLSDFTSPSNPTASTDNTGATINSILISNTASPQGLVSENKTDLPKSAKKIFATVKFTLPEKANVKISAMLINTKNGSKIGPSTGMVSEHGEVTKSFAFTRDKDAWPEGKYEIAVSLSSGATKAVRFEVH